MKGFRRFPLLAASGLMILAVGCAQPPPAPDTRAADEAAIRTADAAWSQAATDGQLDAMLAFYADDATVLAPNAPMASDQQDIRKTMADLFATPGFSLGWQASKVEAARSGEIGYSLGTYQLTVNDADGNPTTDRGKYATVWRKQTDGSWKVIVDIFNTDLPAAPEQTESDAAPGDEGDGDEGN